MMKKKKRIRKAVPRAEPVIKKSGRDDVFKTESFEIRETISEKTSDRKRRMRKKQVADHAADKKAESSAMPKQEMVVAESRNGFMAEKDFMTTDKSMDAKDPVFKSDAISFEGNIDDTAEDNEAVQKARAKRRAIKEQMTEAGDGSGRKNKQVSDHKNEAPAEEKKPKDKAGKGAADEAEITAEKVRAGRKRSRQKLYHLEKRVDENGNETHELVPSKKEPFHKRQVIRAARTIAYAGDEISGGQGSDMDDNDAVKAAGFSLETVEYAGEFVSDSARSLAAKKRRMAAADKKEDRLKKQKQFRKRKLKREYAKAKVMKTSNAAEDGAEAANKASNLITEMASKVREMVQTHSTVIVIAVIFLILLLMVMTSVSSCGGMMAGGLSTTIAGSYQSDPAELDGADAAMTRREMELQQRIDNIETEYPDYDEYNYNLGEIGHDPFTLINYLSAKNIVFTAADVDAQIEQLFNEMYTLTLEERQETRTRTVKNDDDEEVEEEYTVDILDVTLTVTPLEEVVAGHLAGGEADIYDVYGESKGALQQFYTPLDLDWMSLISSYYGYRIDQESGAEQFHRGLDISVPEGSLVYAGTSGVINETGYDDHYGNFIVIKNDDGYEVRYAHLESVSVGTGQQVRHGQLIGKTGRSGTTTGSKLHIECLVGGDYFNPLFYFQNGNGSIYGDTDHFEYPSSDVAALFAEAERYLNYPYVWGGSNPSTSFDCSGFVSYVVTHSGFYDLPRTSAQGIFNKCTPVSAANARPGDLIFFTGTYNSGNPVSHVGIYAGNGQMIHCGDPIKYTSINTPYWQNHFYSYGRLPVNN